MTIQEFSDFFDSCKGSDLAGILVNAKALNADGIASVAKAFACKGNPQAIAKAVFAFLSAHPFILRRGTKVMALDGYPYFVTADTPIQGKDTQIPCTSIIAYGDRKEEQEYAVVLSYGEITC